MMRRLHLLTTVCLACCSSAAFGIVDAEVHAGQSSANWQYTGSDARIKSKQVTGLEIGAAAAVSPLPLVPVSIGVFVASQAYTIDKQAQQVATENDIVAGAFDIKASGKITSLTYGPEIMAWAPLPFVKPFVRLGYVLGNSQEETTLAFTSVSPAAEGTIKSVSKFSTSGTAVGIGLRFSPIPIVGIFAEYQRVNAVHKMTSSSDQMGSTTQTHSLDDVAADLKKQAVQTNTIRLGVHVSI